MDQKTQSHSDSRSTLAAEIAAYQHESARLEASQMGKWVVFKGSDLIAIYETFDAAAEDAVERFGRGPFLIRQVGASPIVMPVSVAYNPGHEEQP
jgi:TPP-dependent pyruvate/acetoin dehydrogenase alpha subunit